MAEDKRQIEDEKGDVKLFEDLAGFRIPDSDKTRNFDYRAESIPAENASKTVRGWRNVTGICRAATALEKQQVSIIFLVGFQKNSMYGTCILGEPPKSLLTLLVGTTLKIRQKIFDSDDALNSKPSLAQRLRWLCTARDRHKLYRKIRRHAANGEIVICDRYPVPILNFMDAPRIPSGFRAVFK